MLSTRFRLCASDMFVSKVILLLLFSATGLLPHGTWGEVGGHSSHDSSRHTLQPMNGEKWNYAVVERTIYVHGGPGGASPTRSKIISVNFNRETLWACAFQFFKSNAHYIGLVGLEPLLPLQTNSVWRSKLGLTKNELKAPNLLF